MNSELKIIGISVKMDSEGRFCLNDLHQAAGGEKRHQPANWLRLPETQELIAKIDNSVPHIRGTEQNQTLMFNNSVSHIRATEQNQSVKVIQGGNPKNQGTFITKDLVYDYAMWISS